MNIIALKSKVFLWAKSKDKPHIKRMYLQYIKQRKMLSETYKS